MIVVVVTINFPQTIFGRRTSSHKLQRKKDTRKATISINTALQESTVLVLIATTTMIALPMRHQARDAPAGPTPFTSTF